MKTKRVLLSALAAAVFLTGMGMLIRQQIDHRKIAEDSAAAASIAGLPEQEPPVQGAPPEPLPDPLPQEAAALADIDLEALRAVNEDVAGWIEIPGTELSYPLVQGADNQYYLTRTWEKEYSSGGAVFLESTNSRDLSDFHTIVYAHRMNNDTMFGTLKYYREQDYWQEHPSIYIAADRGIFRYDIFSAEEASIKSLVYRLDLVTSRLEEAFIQYCLDSSVIDTGVIPAAGDQFLTLSTCTGSGHATRWVVHGVLVQVYDRATEEENGGCAPGTDSP